MSPKGATKELTLVPSKTSKTGRVYSNYAVVSHSPWDFTIRFADAPPGMDVSAATIKDGVVEIPTVAEIVWPVNLMERLIDALTTSHRQYLESYGKSAPQVGKSAKGKADT